MHAVRAVAVRAGSVQAVGDLVRAGSALVRVGFAEELSAVHVDRTRMRSRVRRTETRSSRKHAAVIMTGGGMHAVGRVIDVGVTDIGGEVAG